MHNSLHTASPIINRQTKESRIFSKPVFMLLLIFIISLAFVSCEKDENEILKDGNAPGPATLFDKSLHHTCTDMLEAGDGETLFSFTLSSTKSTTDAVVYYSAANMDFDNSIYLTAGLNINEKPLDDGPSPEGVKVVLPAVEIRKQTEITYYFKLLRSGEEEKIIHFSFELLENGRYGITDSNDPGSDQDFCYYIKADEEGNPCFINVKFH